jgi:hypothetical protein
LQYELEMSYCHNPVLAPSTFEWNRPENGQIFNVPPWVEEQAKVDAQSTLLELFLQIPNHSPRWFYEAPEFRALCSEDILQKLLKGTGKPPPESVVWLDDRSKNGKARHYNGAMSAESLYQNLKLKVRRRAYVKIPARVTKSEKAAD